VVVGTVKWSQYCSVIIIVPRDKWNKLVHNAYGRTNAQNSAAPTKPKTPATPNVRGALKRSAALLRVAVLLEAVEVGVPELPERPGLELVVEEGEEAPVELPLVPPVSVTLLLRQEESVPPVTVTMSEYAVAPVLSFKAMVKLVPDPRSTFQV